MAVKRHVGVMIVAVALVSSCGGSTTTGGTITGNAPTTTGTVAKTTPTSEVVAGAQPAIWPQADEVFATPEEAARDFVTGILGVAPVLGEFQQGDARSGEIEVFSPGERQNATPVGRGRLLLRQLGPDDGWFILAAVNDYASITEPQSMAEIVAGPLTVIGAARGFEGNVNVSAFPAGRAARLDEATTQAGAGATPQPFTVSLDLSSASAGEVIALLVRGGAGLETDPGDFGAIPVVIAH